MLLYPTMNTVYPQSARVSLLIEKANVFVHTVGLFLAVYSENVEELVQLFIHIHTNTTSTYSIYPLANMHAHNIVLMGGEGCD